MTDSRPEGTKNPEPRARPLGVRTRLFLAFTGIAAFSVLAAGAGIYAFYQVGGRLDIVDTRIPPTLSALELSRSAERIIAAAPALLAATDRMRRDAVRAALTTEVEQLDGKLLELKDEGTQVPLLETIEPIVSSLTRNLAILEDLVARRVATNERLRALRRNVFQTTDETQRLLAPWMEVIDSEIAVHLDAREATPADPSESPPRLARLIELQRLTRTAQARVSAIADMLAEASTTDQRQRLSILAFQLRLAFRDLEATVANLDPRLRPLLLEQVAKLREFAEGPNAIVGFRKQELALIGDGEELLAEIGGLSGRLTAAVDDLGRAAKRDIGDAIRDALSVQRLSTRTLVTLVVLSLMTSVLIVWLYVGGSIVRRLTALSDGMLAISGGRLGAPIATRGTDEIAAMGRAVETFRQNTLERDQLLAEKVQAAELLEKKVEKRTAQLAQSVEKLRALGEVSQAVNSTVDLETVLTTIVSKATRLSDTDAGAIYVLADVSRQFRLRAAYGMDEATITKIKQHELHLSQTTVEEAVERGVPIQVADIRSDHSALVLDHIVRAGYRALLFVPLPGVNRIIGALVVHRKQPGEFPGNTIELLQTFAAQSVQAIQNARLFEELQDKSRKLEIANKYKSHFLASASHDLRQPLHALNLFAAQLHADFDPAERERLIGRIDAAVISMNELFDGLLDMSRLEAGVLEPNITEFPIDRLFKRIETTFADTASEKGLRLIIPSSCAWVRSDFVLLERILFNLVSNAVRYTTRGGVLVGCRRRRERARIDVYDSGPGIPEDQRQNVFEECYQLTDTDRRRGLGHGLAIVDRLSHLLDHEIQLTSQPGRGTRFSISVQLVRKRHSAVEIPSARVIADPARDKLVVVIDDDPLVLEAMGGILHKWGCRVLAAESEDAALSRLVTNQYRPDLIIADYRLPGERTGIQAITSLRDHLDEAIPAFLISGDTAPERLRDAGARGFQLLHKPVTPMRLRSMLNHLLSTRDTMQATD